MKKLLFLLVCALLMLVGTAAPALATTPIFYAVDVDGVWAVDRDNQTFWWADYRIPAGANVRIGHTFGFLNRGGGAEHPKGVSE